MFNKLKRQSFDRKPALVSEVKFRIATLFLMALSFSLSLAIEAIAAIENPACESSHLAFGNTDINLESVAAGLARFRLQGQSDELSKEEKTVRDREFRNRLQQFKALVGSDQKAVELYQAQMHQQRFGNEASNTLAGQEKNKAKKQKEDDDQQREREKRMIRESADKPIAANFHDIRPGKFKMGPQLVETEIREPFEMMETKVTQMMWAKIQIFLGETNPKLIHPSHFKTGPYKAFVDIGGYEFEMQPNNPVESIQLDSIYRSLRALNEKSQSDDPAIQTALEDLFPGHQPGDVYSLPTEAQWEFVMRNRGEANQKFFDRDDDSEMRLYAWTRRNSGNQTHPVHSLSPRMIDGKPFFHLEGNVTEWMQDRYADAPPGGIDPLVQSGSDRLSRGSSYFWGDEWISGIHFRKGHGPTDLFGNGKGLRLIRKRANATQS